MGPFFFYCHHGTTLILRLKLLLVFNTWLNLFIEVFILAVSLTIAYLGSFILPVSLAEPVKGAVAVFVESAGFSICVTSEVVFLRSRTRLAISSVNARNFCRKVSLQGSEL